MKSKLYALILILLIGHQYILTQCTISIVSDSLKVPCSGANIGIKAIVDNTLPLMDNNFNDSSIGSGWVSSPAASFNDPCGTVDGSHVLWMGDLTAPPRELETSKLDVNCGGRVCFDFKFAIQGDVSPCEGPDLASEGLNFDCSIDGGNTWIRIAYFPPNPGGCLNSDTNSNGSCTGDYTKWMNYCFDIPDTALTDTTVFRWWQSGGSGANNDHWGMDNIQILANRCSAGVLDWAHISGSPDTDSINEFINSETTFQVSFTSPNVDCNASITIKIDSLENLTYTSLPEKCFNSGDGQINASVSEGSPPYNFHISGPLSTSNPNGVFDNLISGYYDLSVTDAGGCELHDIVSMPMGVQIELSHIVKNLTCNEFNAPCDGEISFNPIGNYGPLTYQWIKNGDTLSNIDTNHLDSLCIGSYTLLAYDSNGCTGKVSVVLSQPPKPVIANFKPSKSKTTVINPTIEFINLSNNSDFYFWNFDSLQITPETDTVRDDNPIFKFPDDLESYLVCLKASDSSGCFHETCKSIVISDYPRVYLPSSFTPDGDGINDNFFPYIDDINDKNYLFTIFDKWGQIVFQTNDYKGFWDGRIKGKEVASGSVFVWTIVYSNVEEQIERYKGHVTLIK